MSMDTLAAFEALPGADLVQKGVEGLAGGIESVESLLVSIGASMLRGLGIDVPHPSRTPNTACIRS